MQHPFYLTALALTFIFSFVLGVFTILLNPKSRVYQLWFLTTMGVAIWSGALFSFVYIMPGDSLGMALERILHIGSAFIIVFFFHFVLVFLMKEQSYKKLLYTNYFLGIIFITSLFIPAWFLRGITNNVAGFERWLEYGPFYIQYFIYYIIFVLISLSLLIKEYNKTDGIKKRQIFFILLALMIGFSGGLTNFFPALFNIYPFGTFVIFLYPILISYGIFFPTIKIRI